jgi:outer membrane immunogenic protein
MWCCRHILQNSTVSRWIRHRRRHLTGAAAPGTFLDSSKDSFLATVRPRVGWAFDHALLYGTGGVAFGTIKTSETFNPPGFTDAANNPTTRTGWTVGGGLEYAFARNWTAKAEYLYVDLGSFNTGSGCTLAPCVNPNDVVYHHKYTDNIARIGVNYLFH